MNLLVEYHIFGYNWNWSNGKLNFCLENIYIYIYIYISVSLGKMWYTVANCVLSFVLTFDPFNCRSSIFGIFYTSEKNSIRKEILQKQPRLSPKILELAMDDNIVTRVKSMYSFPLF